MERSGKNGSWILADADINVFGSVLFLLLVIILSIGSLCFCIPGTALLALGFFCVLDGRSDILPVLALSAMALRFMLAGRGRGAMAAFLGLLPGSIAYAAGLIQGRVLWGLIVIFTAALGTLLLQGYSGGKKKKARKIESGRDHLLFEPVPLTGGETVKNTPAFPLWDGVAAGLCLLLLFSALGRNVSLPADIPSAMATGADWSFESPVLSDGVSDYPDAADYLKHRAYQESFLYGGDYILPRAGDRISLDDYNFSGGKIEMTSRTVLEFSESWFQDAFLSMGKTGVGALLGSEESLPLVKSASSYNMGIPLPLLLASAALVILNVLIRIPGTHPVRSTDRGYGIFVLRRKQQAA